MTSDHTDRSQLRYKNPVFPHSFPDPFVIKHNGVYFAYCTGHWHDGRLFGVLRSTDLITWEALGGAMEALDDPSPFYWAPEVIYAGGTFYLYYSVGNETLMHIRVAVSTRPDGGFMDTGHRLTFQDFAIDAHVFRDDDGAEYLFYATDFLDHTHIGTGIVVDRMLDRFTLAGDPRPVVRAKYDWQVYDPARKEKGGVCWHTVEGPFVFKRKGTYFVMFSGGNWQNPTYGVSFATSSTIEKDGEWDQYCDGEKIVPILRTYPGELIGPGHNSVIRGPNNRELFCVYHCWEHDERVVAVNRMDIVGDRVIVEDKPFSEKLFPFAPDPQYTFGSPKWLVEDERPIGDITEAVTSRSGKRTLHDLPTSFLCEIDFAVNDGDAPGSFGFMLERDTGPLGQLMFSVAGEKLTFQWMDGAGASFSDTAQSTHLKLGTVNHIRLEIDNLLISVSTNDARLSINSWLSGHARKLSLFGQPTMVEWSAFALTEGFENRFERDEGSSLEKLGWVAKGDSDSVVFGDGGMRLIAGGEPELILSKGGPCRAFEFAAAIRLIGPAGPEAGFGFDVTGGDGEQLYRFEVTAADEGFRLVDNGESISFELPLWYQPVNLHRFAFSGTDDELLIDLDLVRIGSVPLARSGASVGIRRLKSEIAVEAVRQTVVPMPPATGA